MLTAAAIERLEAFDGGGALVLTAYLDLDPARRVARSYRVAFEDLVKEIRERVPEPARDELAREASAVAAWLQSHEPGGPGAALSSCAARILAGPRAGGAGQGSRRVRPEAGRGAAFPGAALARQGTRRRWIWGAPNAPEH
jgi:hypothetical protein